MGVFEGKTREFEKMRGFLGGGKKGIKRDYKGLKKASGEVFLEQF